MFFYLFSTIQGFIQTKQFEKVCQWRAPNNWNTYTHFKSQAQLPAFQAFHSHLQYDKFFVFLFPNC